MNKSNLGYVMAIVLILSVISVESGFASVKTFANSNATMYNTGIDSVVVNSRNSTIEKNVSLPQPMDGTDLATVLEKKIKYPEKALNNSVEGEVQVLCTVEANGLVSDLKIMEGDNEQLTQEVAQAMRNVRFKPAMQNGYPVRYTMLIPVRFEVVNRF